jgi:membrane glycosyltransferase
MNFVDHSLLSVRAKQLPAAHPTRSALRVSGPPLRRGSMTSLPWHGFWQGLRRSIAAKAGRSDATLAPAQPWEFAARRRRRVLVAAAAMSGAGGAWLTSAPGNGMAAGWQAMHLVLSALLIAWISAGFLTALMGLFAYLRGDRHALALDGLEQVALHANARTAIVMPICNEDVGAVFAGLRATCESLLRTGQAGHFDVYILSDSNRHALCAAELAAYVQLRALFSGQLNVHYRLRRRRTRRKAGNVADFCRRWGRNYAYMVVLDADSIMSGDCLVNLARLMEREPRAGIIQTAPQAFGLDTLHARMQQFSSSVMGRLFTLGMRYWQLGESHYWGHNAIIRVEPFMRLCGLPPLKGRGGLSGDILSHDFMEAALMRRGGYEVWLAPELQGSYEQLPPNLIEELRRDRRWCQGNLMNLRLIAEPGLRGVHRAMLATAAFAYASAPLWAAFLLSGLVLLLGEDAPALAHGVVGSAQITLWAVTAILLFAPRLMALLLVLGEREAARYGGRAALARSMLLETVWSILLAPVRMAAHSLFVLGALTGLKLEWRSPPREAVDVGWGEATRRFAPYAVLALGALCAAAAKGSGEAAWMLPAGVALILGPALAVWGSRIGPGRALRRRGIACIPEEFAPPAVLRAAQRYSRSVPTGAMALGPLLPEPLTAAGSA